MHFTILLFYILGLFTIQPNTEIAVVNGEPIHTNELKFEMYALRTSVYTYFAGKYLSADETFIWTKKYGNEIPETTLQKRSLNSAIRIKVQQALMKKYGIQKDISYAQFQTEYKHYTAQRAKAIAQGEIIYGPPQISEGEYYHYVFSNNLNQLQDSLMVHKIVDRKGYQQWIDLQVKNAQIKVYSSRLKKIKI